MYHVVYKLDGNLVYETHKDLYKIALIEKKVKGIVRIFNTHHGMSNRKYKSEYFNLPNKTMLILTNDLANIKTRPDAKLVKIEHAWDRTLTEEELRKSRSIVRALEVDNEGVTLEEFKINKLDKMYYSLRSYLTSLQDRLNYVGNKVTDHKRNIIDVVSEVSEIEELDEVVVQKVYEKTKEEIEVIDNIIDEEKSINDEMLLVEDILLELQEIMNKIECENYLVNHKL